MSTPALPDRGQLDARIAGILAQVERIGREVENRHREQDAQRQERARRGELGRDWQTLQRRIDAGETSLEAAFAGDEASPEARALRAASRSRLATLAADEERPDTLTDALADLTTDRSRFELVAPPTDDPDGPDARTAPWETMS